MDQKKINKQISAHELRCSKCGKLLARADEKKTAYQIKCIRCGTLNPIFKGVTDQIIITDSDGVILYANPLVESVTGYSLTEVLGKRPSLWGGQMSKEFYKDMWRILTVDKKPVQVVVKNKKKDGTLYHARLHISPVFGISREIKMFVGIESVINHDKADNN